MPKPESPTSKPEPLQLRVEEAAEVLRLSRAKLYQLLAEGAIPSIKIGRSRRIPVSALESWIGKELESQSVNPYPRSVKPAS